MSFLEAKGVFWSRERESRGRPVTAQEVERCLERLADIPWPWPPGDLNPNGYRTFLDAAEAHLARTGGS
jgi:hypothetical protein